MANSLTSSELLNLKNILTQCQAIYSRSFEDIIEYGFSFIDFVDDYLEDHNVESWSYTPEEVIKLWRRCSPDEKEYFINEVFFPDE